jgi:predicted DNA-binding antitoxin AbrB/MazE fold protein
MSLEIDATHENGTLKLDGPLPLCEHQRVKVTVREEPSRIERSYGLIGWTGDAEVVRRIAEDVEFGVPEPP